MSVRVLKTGTMVRMATLVPCSHLAMTLIKKTLPICRKTGNN